MHNTERSIRVSELFYSVQGEGLYVGVPSIFLRMFGCNFTCSGFSMPRGRKSRERFDVNPSNYKRYEDLPLVHTGCDSYASWDPRFKHLSPWMSYPEIKQKIQDLLPFNTFSINEHLILTGGEPVLWQDKWIGLLTELKTLGLTHITIETNGTQVLSEEVWKWLYYNMDEVVWSISAKLPCSGENQDIAINPNAIKSYLRFHEDWPDAPQVFKPYFKFVVGSPDDIEDVVNAINKYDGAGIRNVPVYLMPAGGTDLHYSENKKWLAEECKKMGFRYSPRLQIDLFGNKWGT